MDLLAATTCPSPKEWVASAARSSISCGQLLVGEATANGGVEHAGEALQGVALHVPVIEAERELANVAAQMLCADVVIGADQAPLEDGKDAFHAVRGHVVADVF